MAFVSPQTRAELQSLYSVCTNSQQPSKGLLSPLHFSVPYPMSPCHPMECSKNMGLIINLCASPCHPRPAGWLERTQAKTLLLPGNLSDYVTE